MAIKLIGTTSGVEVDVDSSKNVYTREGIPAHPVAGGWYTVTGGPTGIVAAALATDTSLMGMRFATGSTRKGYLQKFQFIMSVATVGASAGVAGQIGLQRFTAATPSAGTTRTPCENNELLATATDMTSVQDLASALTVTSIVFGSEVARTTVPLFTTGGHFSWTFEPAYPLVFQPGDGLMLRTRVQMAATQTWVFSYNVDWYEQ